MKIKFQFFALFLSCNIFAQVGINTSNPDPSSILDIVSTNKGVLAPRINLTSTTLQLGTAVNAVGLLIYNNGVILPAGYYFWNGSEWRNIDNSTAVAPGVTSLNCSAANLSPSNYTAGVPYNGYLKIPYTGGNGGKYQPGSSVTVNGLTFILRADKLEYGDGELVFAVSGTPTVSSPAITSVNINSSLVPFITSAQNCTATVGGEDRADIKEIAVLGPLKLNTEGGYANYQQYLTTPDGEFSIRVRTPQGSTFGAADIEIRSNNGPKTIMWNYHTEWRDDEYNGAGNSFALSAGNTWYGNGGSATGGAVSTGPLSAWGDPDVYYFAPEHRRYTWTTTNNADKTMYEAVIMMGAPSYSIDADVTTCPAGTCTSAKAYIIIKQVKAL
ncbi:hypothetical protein B0A69_20145 [Chryseobacterium shigense]|uniref:Uncharacterized protein n=1 Tax=Chryseobacterium shigense TaxID=297244 RepID=A0A1N7I195_9FLAO|nr:hypothetical protein [Chryseobacterium shigense]PQA90640.1 hypothetical protein B0A69_20145 [Chryseobacterium shigense]SIS30855.1 hypothetical protein SAMN05421639_1011039 [Chryseobacterium shigense]